VPARRRWPLIALVLRPGHRDRRPAGKREPGADRAPEGQILSPTRPGRSLVGEEPYFAQLSAWPNVFPLRVFIRGLGMLILTDLGYLVEYQWEPCPPDKRPGRGYVSRPAASGGRPCRPAYHPRPAPRRSPRRKSYLDGGHNGRRGAIAAVGAFCSTHLNGTYSSGRERAARSQPVDLHPSREHSGDRSDSRFV